MTILKPIVLAAAALAATMAFSGCGGGSNGGNGGNSGATTNTGNTETSGTQAKQLNPLHKLHNALSGKVLNINMGAMNGSKQDGTASVSDKGTGIVVVVHLNNEPKGASEPSHIHQGTCKNINPAPWKLLKNVVDGSATSTVAGVTVAQLKKAHYAINVHKSANDLKTYVSCGDLTP
ncbi:MAG TPA: hypothetical protein VGZ02_00505 [Candidatus Baltobacteraceae bacterium]|nr:hypothetical protein [Candidatus Baltobacteraceae bacterium]